MSEEHAEDIQQVIERLEVMHGDIISRVGEEELDREQAGKAVAYQQAIQLLESAQRGGLDTDPDHLTPEQRAQMSEFISASRAWRNDDA